MISVPTVLRVVAASAVLAIRPVAAEDVSLLPPALGVTEWYASDGRTGFGLDGLDPVSFLVDLAPRAGLPDHEARWGGLVWRFSGEANRRAFLRDPASFLPRIGGHDPVRAARGAVVAGRPDIFTVSNGRLYLFFGDADRARFLADETLAAQAEARWPALRAGLVRD